MLTIARGLWTIWGTAIKIKLPKTDNESPIIACCLVTPVVEFYVLQKELNPKTIVIVGPTSSGKTELAKALQESFLPNVWLHFSVDTLIYALPESVLARCNYENDWSGVDGGLLFQSAVLCLKTLAQTGNSVIFDLVIPSEKKVEELNEALNGIDTFRIELTCDWEEIRKRTIDRADRTIAEAERSFKSKIKGFRPDAAFDTTKSSTSMIAGQVILRLKNKTG